MLQVYTGNGKGKTTAALGQALRALGHGKKVLLLQFMKKGSCLGEVKAARRFSRLTVIQAGRACLVKKGKVTLKDKKLARAALETARKNILSKKYDLIILDELNVAVEFGLLELKNVKRLLQARPKSLEIILTGRCAHPEILEMADLVSEIKEIKHYYNSGVTARMGVEY